MGVAGSRSLHVCMHGIEYFLLEPLGAEGSVVVVLLFEGVPGGCCDRSLDRRDTNTAHAVPTGI